MPKRRVGEDIEIWCRRHWDPVLESRIEADPINGTAATEFLLRRFNAELVKDPLFKADINGGTPPEIARNKALANLAPICCLFGDDSIQELHEQCRFSRISRSHPVMNDDDDPEGLKHFMPNGEPLLER